MATLTKSEMLTIIRRAYGPDFADNLSERLPPSVDLDSAADIAALSRLGLTRDRIVDALGGEL